MGHNYPKLMEKLDVVQFNHYNNFDTPECCLAKTPLWFHYLAHAEAGRTLLEHRNPGQLERLYL